MSGNLGHAHTTQVQALSVRAAAHTHTKEQDDQHFALLGRSFLRKAAGEVGTSRADRLLLLRDPERRPRQQSALRTEGSEFALGRGARDTPTVA